MIDAFREHMGISLTVFKIGVTSNPVPRFVLYRTKHFTDMGHSLKYGCEGNPHVGGCSHLVLPGFRGLSEQT